MGRFRSILASILALVMVFVVSCAPQQAAKPPVYSPSQLEIIAEYKGDLLSLRDRMSELEQLIVDRKWVDVETFIHGPLGDLRRDMSYVTRNLDDREQKTARRKSQALFSDLEAIDAAAAEADYSEAVEKYGEAIVDFDAFLDLIPSA
ncbi:photosystem II protein PsbQ [Phormidium sp. CCY1219]|uniref:photosystem II protein PsbQ n=1 Tax=Phormidium sp. CCY1219 TaxID=2886104 RepID=UPI002D1EB287|nr:photosystem II protein PsbQ [Phormidium sp. CCY1219]MEB3829765.1 photosystem II protein PsbQ [Phormidium sp. CCY1219]